MTHATINEEYHPVPCFIKIDGVIHEVTFSEWSEYTYRNKLPDRLQAT